MATFKPIVFKTKNHIKSDGTTNIKIRVYHNKESQYIPTDYYVEPSFMCDDGTINTLYPEADLFNFELGEIIQSVSIPNPPSFSSPLFFRSLPKKTKCLV